MGLGNAWGVRLPCTEDISRVRIPGAPHKGVNSIRLINKISTL